MRKIHILLLIFIALVFVSCREEKLDEEMSNFRNNLVSKNMDEQKKVFNHLNSATKINFWENKVSQVLTQNLNEQQRDLVEEILTELPKSQLNNKSAIKLVELAIRMAKITPQEEFINMFVNYGDYYRNQKLYTPELNNDNNKFIINELEVSIEQIRESKRKLFPEDNSMVSENATNGQVSGRILPDCNCSWTCGFYGGHHNNCTPTDSGCGLFGQYGCGGHTGP